MILKELKEAIERVYNTHGSKADDLIVGIPNNKPGMGPLRITNVKGARKGIDWDSGTFFIWPEVPMKEKEQLNGTS